MASAGSHRTTIFKLILPLIYARLPHKKIGAAKDGSRSLFIVPEANLMIDLELENNIKDVKVDRKERNLDRAVRIPDRREGPPSLVRMSHVATAPKTYPFVTVWKSAG